MRAITTIDVPTGSRARNSFLKISRTRRFTRFRTTALPILRDTVTPSRERDGSRSRLPAYSTKWGLWKRTPSRWRRKNSALRCSRSTAAKLNCARTGLLARLLGRDRDRQPRAALGPAALEYLASARRGHPRQESMSSFATAVMRLVGPFHCAGPVSLSFEFRPARSVSRSGLFRPARSFKMVALRIDPEHAIEPYRAPMSKHPTERKGRNSIVCETRGGFRASFGRTEPCTQCKEKKTRGFAPVRTFWGVSLRLFTSPVISRERRSAGAAAGR